MFVTEDMVSGMVARFGCPHNQTFRFPVLPDEYDLIRNSQKHGRRHDVTIYLRYKNKYVVIAKPFYPPGQYRAPSGGLSPGESFDDGIAREMLEETGCNISVCKFLLRTRVFFELSETPPTWTGSIEDSIADQNQNSVINSKSIDWCSFVFLADYVSGDFKFTDKHEISEVRLATLDEFDTFSEIMRRSDIGGLHYRAALHDTIIPLLPT